VPGEPASTDAQQRILGVLVRGPATLARIRSAFPAGDAHARALPSMGEPDPLGEELTALVLRGLVLDEDGTYRLPER
jgi:hypothetical protein